MKVTRRAYYHPGKNVSGLFRPKSRAVVPAVRVPEGPFVDVLPVDGAAIRLNASDLVEVDGAQIQQGWTDDIGGIVFDGFSLYYRAKGIGGRPAVDMANGIDSPDAAPIAIDLFTFFMVVNRGESQQEFVSHVSAIIAGRESSCRFGVAEMEWYAKSGFSPANQTIYSITDPVPENTDVILTFRTSADRAVKPVLQCMQNGVAKAAVETVAAQSPFSIQAPINLLSKGSLGYAVTRLAEFIYYPRILTAAEVAKVNRFLNRKYQLY